MRHIIEHSPRVEAELGDDLDGEPGRLGCSDLLRQRPPELVRPDLGMAVGIAGDADAADAAAAEHAGIDRVMGAAERPAFGAVAGDHQHAAHLRLIREPRHEIVERLGAGEIAHRHMRHRLEACRAQPHRGADEIPRPHVPAPR